MRSLFSLVKLKVISSRKGKLDYPGVIAEGVFGHKPTNSLTYDELTDENAQKLKTELRKAADEAVSHFRQKVLNM